MRMTRSSLILMVWVSLAGAAVAGAVAPAKSWTKDNDCSWWLAGADGKSHRASITRSSDGVLFSISDPAFVSWSDADLIQVELRFNRDAKRRVVTKGWVTRGEGYGMFGLYLDAAALRKTAGATTLEFRRQGKVIVEQKLSSTPNKSELLACLPGPSIGPSDSE